MPYTLKQNAKQEWCVYRKGAGGEAVGKTFGCHSTKKKAVAQIGAIASSERRKEEIVNDVDAVLVASNRPLQVLEEADGGLRIKGVALIDEAISSNRRYYSAKFNDACMEATNRYMAEGGTVTIFSRHGNAVGQGGQMPTALPIGKVTDPLYRNEGAIWYDAKIVETTEGEDVIKLIKAEVLLATSIRAIAYKSRMRRINGQDVEELIEATIVGIDTTDEAGIRGAGIREVLEEAPEFEEEEDMDYEKLTLEELLEHRKDLLDAHAASVQEAMQVKVDEADELRVKAEDLLAEAITNLEAKGGECVTLLEEKQTSADAVEAQVADLGLKLKIAKAANFGGMATLVFEELTEKVKCEEDIEKYLGEARDRAVTAVLGQAGGGEFKGKTKVVVEEAPKQPAEHLAVLGFVSKEG